jgi:hypothetical protein
VELDVSVTRGGGRTWSASSDRELRELFTYTPRGTTRPGWHELKVKLKSGGAEITARPGYFVSESSPPQ